VGAPHQLRLGFHGEYFSAKDVVIAGDSAQRLSGGLAVGYTVRRDLELFGAFLNSSNRNQRRRAPDDRDPELIKTFGDLMLGGKWSIALSSAATLGAEFGLKLLSGVSDLAISPSSTSWWVGPLFTYDLRSAGGVPLRFHAGASFYADNSYNLRRFSGVTRATKEAAMFGYGMGPSRLRLALAVDAPLEKLFPRVPLVPFVEYHLAYVTAAADADFQDYMAPSCGTGPGGSKPCTDNRDMQFVTLGVRAAVYRGITADLGMDIRVRSAGFPYGPPLPPYNVIFGVSYPFDVDSLTRTVVVTRTVEPSGPWKMLGQLGGVVRSAAAGKPISGAEVAVVGQARARVVTDADGGFATPPLSAGLVELEVTAAEFIPVRVAATVVAGQVSEVAIVLAPAPPRVGKIHGRVTGPTGAGIPAAVKLVGLTVVELKCDATGTFSAVVPPGAYELRVEAPEMVPSTVQVETRAGDDKELDVTLRAVVSDPGVSLSGGRVQVKRPIRFAGATAQLTPPSQHLLDALADLLQVHAEINRVRISAHWDNSLPRPRALELTQRQAEAVRVYLVGKGVADTRLTAKGEGAARPLVPNLSPANSSRNRRVEFRAE
jgi:outer membrane protein OmpA-like peptidoglycan-associated protein